MIALPIVTDWGTFTAHYSDKGLAELDFPGRGPAKMPSADNIPSDLFEIHTLTSQALVDAVAGKRPSLMPPLDLHGSEFQKRVWAVLLTITPGATLSYGEVALRLGSPHATRAVGGACGANPIPVLVPCHRVLAANRKLGGFSGGLEWKLKLLAVEGIAISQSNSKLEQPSAEQQRLL